MFRLDLSRWLSRLFDWHKHFMQIGIESFFFTITRGLLRTRARSYVMLCKFSFYLQTSRITITWLLILNANKFDKETAQMRHKWK